LTPQVLAALEFEVIFKTLSVTLLLQLIATLFLLGYSHLPVGTTITEISYAFLSFAAVILCTILLPFGKKCYRTFSQDYELAFLDEEDRASRRRLDLSAEANVTTWIGDTSAPRKNLILMQIESLEACFIGHLNPRYPDSMPWLSSYMKSCSWFSNIETQPYTQCTAAGSFVSQCGIPAVHWMGTYRHGSEHALDKFPCVGKYLANAGYKLYAYLSGFTRMMNHKDLLEANGYEVRDWAELQTKTDRQFLEILISDVLPRLAKEEGPFVLHAHTGDTHWPMAYEESPLVKKLKDKGYPKSMQAFTWADELLKKFTNRLIELGLDKNTEYAIYGDHIAWGGSDPDMVRNLTIILPFRKCDDKCLRGRKKELSYYDLPPTFMNLMGVKYHPEFAFGSDIFGEKSGRIPNENDFQYIREIYSRGPDSLRAGRFSGDAGP
jgi:phosphoglycerol transferase MdoB-like AlkP superfamily enzyme